MAVIALVPNQLHAESRVSQTCFYSVDLREDLVHGDFEIDAV